MIAPADSAEHDAAALWLAGYLTGAVRAIAGIAAIVEAHEIDGNALPSFAVTLGRHELVVHVDQAIA